MDLIDHGPLGQKSEYPETYAPQVMYPIARSLGRSAIGLQSNWPWQGVDVWNAYELSWLNPAGKPVVAMLELRVPANSSHIVESKSLKLYLGSLNQSAFASTQALEQVLARDISAVVGAPVQAVLLQLTSSVLNAVAELPGFCIDALDIEAKHYRVNAGLLRRLGDAVVAEQLHSHLLRSCCPVTGQPDWGSVYIDYEGAKIDPVALLQYIVSFRTNQEFHEQCVERIFMDLMTRCQPQKLTVYARYTRRGGIDINPWRSTETGVAPNWRLVRQ